jgi:hypothetical protein
MVFSGSEVLCAELPVTKVCRGFWGLGMKEGREGATGTVAIDERASEWKNAE